MLLLFNSLSKLLFFVLPRSNGCTELPFWSFVFVYRIFSFFNGLSVHRFVLLGQCIRLHLNLFLLTFKFDLFVSNLLILLLPLKNCLLSRFEFSLEFHLIIFFHLLHKLLSLFLQPLPLLLNLIPHLLLLPHKLSLSLQFFGFDIRFLNFNSAVLQLNSLNFFLLSLSELSLLCSWLYLFNLFLCRHFYFLQKVFHIVELNAFLGWSVAINPLWSPLWFLRSTFSHIFHVVHLPCTLFHLAHSNLLLEHQRILFLLRFLRR